MIRKRGTLPRQKNTMIQPCQNRNKRIDKYHNAEIRYCGQPESHPQLQRGNNNEQDQLSSNRGRTTTPCNGDARNPRTREADRNLEIKTKRIYKNSKVEQVRRCETVDVAANRNSSNRQQQSNRKSKLLYRHCHQNDDTKTRGVAKRAPRPRDPQTRNQRARHTMWDLNEFALCLPRVIEFFLLILGIGGLLFH